MPQRLKTPCSHFYSHLFSVPSSSSISLSTDCWFVTSTFCKPTSYSFIHLNTHGKSNGHCKSPLLSGWDQLSGLHSPQPWELLFLRIFWDPCPGVPKPRRCQWMPLMAQQHGRSLHRMDKYKTSVYIRAASRACKTCHIWEIVRNKESLLGLNFNLQFVLKCSM